MLSSMTQGNQPRPLLNNDFAPVTFTLGFVESSFPALCGAFQEWSRAIDAKYSNLRTEFTPINAPLGSVLFELATTHESQ